MVGKIQEKRDLVMSKGYYSKGEWLHEEKIREKR